MARNGLRLLDFKLLSKDAPIEEFPYPDKVTIPFSQHAGIPAKPVVKKGDRVLENQVIAEPAGFISGFIHSSVSGKVTALQDCLLPTGQKSLCAIIESDGTRDIEKGEESDWKDMAPDDIISAIRQAGIAGLGGAAFPSHVKLSPPEDKLPEYIILNGCECEPFLTADYRMMKESPEEVVEGLAVLCRAAKVSRSFICLEKNKRDLVPSLVVEAERLKKITAGKLDIRIKILPELYPQGSEKQLIKSTVDREVPSGGLPMDVSCIVFNVQTAFAVQQALKKGCPLTERVLTLSGLVKNPRNLRVRIGTSFSDILSYAEEETGSRKLVSGGPMMGVNLHTADVPVIKSTSGILLLPEERLPERIMPCIRCGKCIETCPMNLVPAEIGRYAESGEWEICKSLDLTDCVECGCCSYICPAKRPLTALFKWGKAELRRKDS